MHGYLPRSLSRDLESTLQRIPAVALLGPRQCGKTTLVHKLVETRPHTVYLDLENPADRRKLQAPELYFPGQREEQPDAQFCLDEIQMVPELFPLLRGLIDQHGENGQFLLLGSASRDLIRQSSESLAGRLHYLELTPLLALEVDVQELKDLQRIWIRGGFPRSYLAAAESDSVDWRANFVRSFLERDIPQLGFDIPAETLRRLWRMLAHNHGQLLNSSRLGSALGVSHTTVRSYIDLLEQTFMVRCLEPLEANVKKRLMKSPKVYVRDSGIVHSLLEIDDMGELLGHPVAGASWEGLVIENAIAALPRWRPNFYRTSNGAEIDLVLSRGRRRIAVECKASAAPTVTRGFWNALEDIQADEAWVVAPVDEPYPLRENVKVAPLGHFLKQLTARAPALNPD